MNNIHIDIDSFQKCKNGQNSYGDVFLKKYIKEENRKILVLSDGMGSGIKANVLATLTASMSLNFVQELKDIHSSSELIMNILPKCSERKISYSTFTILDIKSDNSVEMIVYDSPLPIIISNNVVISPQWDIVELTDGEHQGKKIFITKYQAKLEDRIIFFTDGITQSGLGINSNITGWAKNNIVSYVQDMIKKDKNISSKELSAKIVHKAELNDDLKMKDDASCASVYFREPRELMICSGPPKDRSRDLDFAMKFKDSKGKKIICGGTTSDIIKRELDLNLVGKMKKLDDDLPPISFFENIDLVTEGVMTLSKVEQLLKDLPKLDDLNDG
ncbi:MAG: SpoIIE family protein phosphatase, partial [Candidatus Delongbacteria bacterium]|nr:SpoIIE family protein phosphatase [Candidatus Delongbacteria bacterium]